MYKLVRILNGKESDVNLGQGSLTEIYYKTLADLLVAISLNHYSYYEGREFKIVKEVTIIEELS